MDKINWIINKHKETNHMYDNYLPYEFHLRMVVKFAKKFMSLVIHKDFLHTGNPDYIVIILASYGHDLIEDTRTNYNEVRENLGFETANIIYALTNEKGRNRKERANDKYYKGIRETEYAAFVKLCDRIANVEYSKITNSSMFEMYKEENDSFMQKLGYIKGNEHKLEEMFKYLINLLTIPEKM